MATTAHRVRRATRADKGDKGDDGDAGLSLYQDAGAPPDDMGADGKSYIDFKNGRAVSQRRRRVAQEL